jgi:thioredoxin-like negative regulator of GroEL
MTWWLGLCLGAFRTGPSVPAAAMGTARSRALMVTELTKASWCREVDGAETLAVVFFYARWCRNCKAVKPIYARMEREYSGARFYQVNFKAETQLCYQASTAPYPPLGALVS